MQAKASKVIPLKNTKTVKEAIEFANNNARMLADDFLTRAKDYKPNKPSYVCCFCNNGAGTDGTGMQFYTNEKGEPSLKCHKCQHRTGNIINWIGYKELHLSENDFKSKDFIKVLELIGQKYNFTISDNVDIVISKDAKEAREEVKDIEIKEVLKNTMRVEEVKEKQGKEDKKDIDLSKAKKVITRYIYTDENGEPIKANVKYEYFDENNKRIKKEFKQEDLINKVYGLNRLTDEQKAILYNSPAIQEAKEEDKLLFYVEGEKDVNTLKNIGVLATTSGSAKPLNELSLNQLQGVKRMLIIPDNDLVGYKSSVAIFNQLKGIGIDVKILNWQGTTNIKGYDITDYIEEKRQLYKDKSDKDILDLACGTDGLIQDNTDAIEDELEDEAKPKTLQGVYDKLEEMKYYMINHGAIKQDGTLKITPNKIAQILYNVCHCIIINYNPLTPDANPLAIYNARKGIYVLNNSFIDSLIKRVDENISINKVEQVKYDLKNILYTHGKIKELTQNPNKVILANGIYNRETNELEPFTPKFISDRKGATRYNPKAQHPAYKDNWNFDKWITDDIAENDKGKEFATWQMIANSVYNNENNKMAYTLYDEQSNTGKSTMLLFIKNLVGAENTASANLEKLEERFTPSSLVGASVIIGDDNNHGMNLTKSANFKTIVSGDPMQVEEKGKKPMSYSFKTTVLQAMNGFPRFKIDDGLINRLNIIKFGKSYKGAEINYNVKEKYTKDKELLEYILFKALHTPTRPIYKTQECLEFLGQLGTLSDDIIAFKEDIVKNLVSVKIPTEYLYELYKLWTQGQQNTEHISRVAFTSRIKPQMKSLGYIDGSHRINKEEWNVEEDLMKITHLLSTDDRLKENFINIVFKLKGQIEKGTVRAFIKQE